MNEANRNYIAVGVFVIAMLALLIIWFAVLMGLSTSRDSYFIRWDNVMGLKPGTQILFEGYQIGLIESISRNADSAGTDKNYRVEIGVEEGWPIPDSAVAETTAPTFLAALVVNIDAGDSSKILAPGDEIVGKEPGDLLSAANDLMSSVSDTLEFVKPRIEEITTSVGTILSEENASDIQAILKTVNDRVGDILSKENSDTIRTILTNLEGVTVDVAEMTSGLRDTKGEIDDVLGKVNYLIDTHSGDIGTSLIDLRGILESVSRHIDAIASNLESTTHNANEFSSQIRENPGVLLRGRDSADDGAK